MLQISQLPLVSLFNAKKAERHAERSFASIKKHQEIYLNRVRFCWCGGGKATPLLTPIAQSRRGTSTLPAWP
jgi:hypothetical protein